MVRDDLSFGCSTLGEHDSPTAALGLLARATDLGIRHFDTAQAYGLGRSEELLGQHVKGRRDEFLITTKYGLAPPIASPRLRANYERAAASSGASPLLGVLRRARRALRGSPFSPGRIRIHLEQSLRSLGTDYVDFFLLHEATGAQANRTVTRTLEQLVAEGKVREFGLGSAHAKIGPYVESLPAGYTLLQFEHGPLAATDLEAVTRAGRKAFTHSALSNLGDVVMRLEREPARAERWSRELEVDVLDPTVLPGLLLAYSHLCNPTGRVIFSTRSAERLEANVAAFGAVRAWDAPRQAALKAALDELTGPHA